ncbi:hypothetical protein KKB40_02465 [Patescibacteria group bacterium]|nr:hypothetical protein [Patescibacteria group bacterium]
MTNKNQKDKEFNTLMAHIKRMQSRYFHALCAFYAYEGMREIAAPNIIGKSKAAENVRTMDRYRNFFVIAQEALQHYFFLELGKLFDASDQSLHINKVVNFTEGNLKKLTVDAFKAYNQDRQLLKELTERYKGVEHSDLTVIKDLLDKQKNTIEKLKTYRDSWVAHDDAKKPQRPGISVQEIKDLFSTLKKILNTISGKLNDETWSYHHVEGDVKNHVNLVIDHLRRFEPYRLKEIDADIKRKYKAVVKS